MVRLGRDPRGPGVPTFSPRPPNGRSGFTADAWKVRSPLPEQWESTFRLHAAPLMDKPVDRIASGDVLRCLVLIWTTKPAAAWKDRHRIAAVFRCCIGRNYRPGNPVDRAVAAPPRVNGTGPEHYRALSHSRRRCSVSVSDLR